MYVMMETRFIVIGFVSVAVVRASMQTCGFRIHFVTGHSQRRIFPPDTIKVYRQHLGYAFPIGSRRTAAAVSIN